MIRPLNASVTKEVNRASVLTWIREHQPAARNSIAGNTGLTPSTVTNIVREFIQEGIVHETGTDVSRGGRRAVLLTLEHEKYAAIGVVVKDIQITVVACDLHGKVLKRTRIDMETFSSQRGEQLLHIAAVAARHLADHMQEQGRHLIGAGVGVSGLVNHETGEAVFCPKLGLRHQPVNELFARHLNLPILVDNDTRAMALGETWFGAGRGRENVVCIHVASGLGAAVVQRGQLYYGHADSAAELGHTVIDHRGPLCQCGHRGCLEALAGGNAVLRSVAEKIRAGEESSLSSFVLSSPDELTYEAIGRAADEGDEVARSSVIEAAEYLGIGIANAVNAFAPELVVLGGPFAQASRLYVDIARKVANEFVYGSPERRIDLVEVALGDNASAVGAATMVLAEFFHRGGTIPARADTSA